MALGLLPGQIAARRRLGLLSTARAQYPLVPPGYSSGPNAPFDGSPAPGGFGTNAFSPNNYGPSSPTRPTDPARPNGWPGGPTPQTTVQQPAVQQPAAATTPPPPQKDPTEPPYEPAAILAHVGSEVVQAADILPSVHQRLDPFIEQLGAEFEDLPDEVKQRQIKQWKRELTERTLEDAVKIKLLISEIRRVADAEAIDKNIENIREQFNQVEIKELIKRYKASGIVDLENKLRAQGGSLESQRMVYVERLMAGGWLHQQVRQQKEPTHEEMIDYYRQHTADWERPARARWEQLTAAFDEFSNKAEAWRAIAAWGRQVQSGAPLPQVAKANSHGFTADQGGLNDWTTQGSLRSEAIDQALFGLPVGALSPILEDDQGFHIVRVLEREPRHMVPFAEVQDEIKQKLKTGDQNSQMEEYLAKLEKRTPVQTVFDEDATIGSLPGNTRR